MSTIMDKLVLLRNQGIIRDIEVELCRFLKTQDKETGENVLLGACLLSYLYRQGDVCLSLEKYAGQPLFSEEIEAADDESSGIITAPDLSIWKRDLQNSSLVGRPGEFKPLILDKGNRLYLHKLWHFEHSLAEQLLQHSNQRTRGIDTELLENGLNRVFPADEHERPDWQRVAAAQSVRNRLSIISGGPGTGKTSTVVRVLALLIEQAQNKQEDLSIALTAPTGKAAARLKDSIVSAKAGLKSSDRVIEAIPGKTMTLHQLLGARRNSSEFRYNRDNPLPYDLVIVDEASMVDQVLISKLMEALLEKTGLILLGDKDQLASVEAGSVLGDICGIAGNQLSRETVEWLQKLSLPIPGSVVNESLNPLQDNITLLTKSYRFGTGSGIANLAATINKGAAPKALEIMNDPRYGDLHFVTITNRDQMEELMEKMVTDYFQQISRCSTVGRALEIYNSFRVLAAHRRGRMGVEYLNRWIGKLVKERMSVSKYEQWYRGRPVIIKVNDYHLNLFNGDTGICFEDSDGRLKVFFQHEKTVRSVAPGRLPSHDTAYALTVHKSQGSEFEDVVLVLPMRPSPVMTRELLYTAVTRARTSMRIWGSEFVFSHAIEKKLQRSSGLRDRLWGD